LKEFFSGFFRPLAFSPQKTFGSPPCSSLQRFLENAVLQIIGLVIMLNDIQTLNDSRHGRNRFLFPLAIRLFDEGMRKRFNQVYGFSMRFLMMNIDPG